METKRLHLWAGLAAAAILLARPAAGDEAKPASLFDDVVVAKGEGVEVRRAQLDDAFIAYKANLAARGQNIPEGRRLTAEAELLDRLIISQLLVRKATTADKAKAAEKATTFLEESRKGAGSDEAFQRQLRVLGMSAPQFTNRIVEQAIAEELLGRELRSKILISPEQIRHFWETNDAVFRQPEMARASHILIYTRDLRTRQELPDEQKKAKLDKAEKALARARKGEDFTKLVEEFSEDPMVKENKGEYRFTRAKDDPRRAMVAEFEVAAFALKPGEISRLVKTEYGYHIIKLHEIIPAHKTPLLEVNDKIKENLTNQELERQLPDYFGKLKTEAKVEILDERLKEALAQALKEGRK
jgi:parvulin-like peptidyl-prolyl isomerase